MLSAAGGAALAIGLPATAEATTLKAGKPVRVPDHPWAGTSTACDNVIKASVAAGSVNYSGAEVEPYVVANPVSSSQLVAAFQQDRWNDGGNNGEVAAYSANGGASWTLSGNQPAFTICAGGRFDRASDPWLAWSADGRTLYQASLAFDVNGPAFGGESSVQVSSSADGGASWHTPAVVQDDVSTTVLNDKDAITADPTQNASAYLVWDRLVSPSTNASPDAFPVTPAFRGPALFSKTTDRGTTWSPSQVIFDPGQNDQTIGNEIVVPSPGTLVDGFNLITNQGNIRLGGSHFHHTQQAAVVRSTDGGATWSGPTIVSQIVDAPVSIDGTAVRTGDSIPQFTTDPSNGNIYAVWQDGRFSSTGAAKVAFSQSTDGGRTWSGPIRIDQSPGDAPAFTPAVHVSSDGTIGVTYYDLQNATAKVPGATDVYIVHCHARTSDCTQAASWAAGGETRLTTTGSFDMTKAPFAEGYFTGDYEGLASSGNVFDPFSVLAKPVATAGATDPFAFTAG